MTTTAAWTKGDARASSSPGLVFRSLPPYPGSRAEVWIDCPDPGWGSLVGNALYHGVGYTYGQYRDHFGSHCGMEVVPPNGEVMRTGMAALANDQAWADATIAVAASAYAVAAAAQAPRGAEVEQGKPAGQ